MLVCAGEVAGPHGHERDAADSRAQAAPQAPARQGVLPSRGRKVSCWIRAQHFRELFRQSERFRVENFSFLKFLSPFFLLLLTTFVSYKGTKIYTFSSLRFFVFLPKACPDKKENQIFLIYREVQSGAVAKSYTREGFLIYVEMRKYFTIYGEAVSHI